MKVFLNGKVLELPVGTTIAAVVEQKKLNPATVIVEYNLEVVSEEVWSEIVLKEEDRLEILHFVGGG